MFWVDDEEIYLESFEPQTHVCWECGHCPHDKKYTNMLTICPLCGREWIFGEYLDNFENLKEFVDWLKEMGIKKYDSTTNYEREF